MYCCCSNQNKSLPRPRTLARRTYVASSAVQPDYSQLNLQVRRGPADDDDRSTDAQRDVMRNCWQSIR
jgi:hypothetical protein